MTTPFLCPDARCLQQMLSGVLPLSDDEAAQLEQHLRDCGRCDCLADVFPDNDTLIEALRTQADSSEAQHPLIQQMVARLSRLQPPGSEVTMDLSQSQDAALAPPLAPDEIGRLGGYRVLKMLGTGGMGMVYQAEDVRLQRPIALKVMKAEVSNNPGNRERFLREARAAAKLKSDHVVNLYQVGEERQIVFLAMEFLEGMSLDDWLKKDRKPTWAQAARIGRQIALGLADAHACGLIHRDIKPGNIWLDSRHQGRVKLLDFGLARGNTEEVQLTQSGAIVGTPAYMAPEQARGEHVDFRADLFSLGVVLYRMTTGQLPFRGDNTMSILTALALDTPTPPREINSAIPPRLAALIESLLAKDRTQRPATAKAVADELAIVEREATQPAADQRTVQVQAAPVVRAAHAAQRSKRLRWFAAASLLLLLGGIAAAVVVIIRDKQGNKVAEINLPEGHSVEVKADDKAKPPEKDKQQATAIPADPLPKIEPGTPLGPLALVTNPAPLPGVRSWTIETRTPRGGIMATAYRPDGRMLATAGDDGVIRLLEPSTGRLLHALVGHASRIMQLAWSPDGRTLASGSGDGTVRLWDADSGRHLRTLMGLPGFDSLLWLPDGRTVAAFQYQHMLAWNAVSGEIVRNLALPQVHRTLFRALSPDGKYAAATEQGGKVRILEAETGQEVRTLPGHPAGVLNLAWSPDGRRLASTGNDRTLRLWQVETGKELWSLKTPDTVCRQMCWSPDGKRLAVNTDSRVVKFIQVEGENPLLASLAIPAGVGGMCWSSDGEHFALGDSNGRLWLMKGVKGIPVTVPGVPGGSFLMSLAWSPDSKHLAAARHSAGLRVVNPATGETSASLTDVHDSTAWSPSKWLAASGPDSQLTLWQPGGIRRILPAHKTGYVGKLAWSPDAKTLADAGAEPTVRLWDGDTRQLKREWNPGGSVNALTWSPDGKLLATGISRAEPPQFQVKLWSTDTGEERRTFPGFSAVVWSPVGDTLAVFGYNGSTVQLLNAKTGELGVKLPIPSPLQGAVWSPDGKFLATGYQRTYFGTGGPFAHPGIQVWDAATGDAMRKLDRVCLLEFSNHGLMAWSPNGKRIAAGGHQTIQLWDAATGKSEGVIFPNPQFHGLTLRPDGHYRGDAEVDGAIVMVVQKEDGSTETLPPAEFARKYKWKNEP